MAARVVLIQSGLDELLKSPSGPLAADLLRRTLRVEATAKRLCPVDTGRLRASISHEIQTDSHGLIGVVGSNVEYASFVEFGTSRSRAQPYLRPALDAAR